jgi:hypothetical protein
MVLTPLVRGLLGIDVDAPAGHVTLAPHLPPEWDSVRVEHVPVGGASVSFTIRRTASHVTAELTRSGGAAPIDVVFSPALPLGATTQAEHAATPGDVHATVRGTLRDRLTLDVPYAGGWTLVPPRAHPRIGDRSSAARVLSERLANGKYVATLEGLAGRTYRFKLRPPNGVLRDEDVTFPSTGANADGYVTLTLTKPQ